MFLLSWHVYGGTKLGRKAGYQIVVIACRVATNGDSDEFSLAGACSGVVVVLTMEEMEKTGSICDRDPLRRRGSPKKNDATLPWT
jgi:hypothetical protein